MPRRKRRRYRPPRRLLVFAPAALAALWLWSAVQATGMAGLAILLAVCLIFVPCLMLALLFALPSAPSLLVPRRWRIAYRRASGREGARSTYVPKYLYRMVLAADRYRCVYCGARGPFEVDHIRPWSQGGMVTLWNLMTLCVYHNQAKSGYWPGHYYRPRPGFTRAHEPLAAAILAVERRARLNPLRWVRAAAALKP